VNTAAITLPEPASPLRCISREPGGLSHRSRTLPEETPVAFVYQGTGEAVMLATPADLEDFAVGFSFTEGLIQSMSDIRELDVLAGVLGIELRLWLTEARAAAHRLRARHRAGPTGCGLCGVESLADAARPVQPVAPGISLPAGRVGAAVAALCARQALSHETHATHAAGLYRPESGAIMVREDIGRHNALDKLAGALLRAGVPAESGVLVITSRVSVEMVQKAAAIGAPILIAMSAPTALAVRTAEAANMTLVAGARGSAFQVYTHPWRIEAPPCGADGIQTG